MFCNLFNRKIDESQRRVPFGVRSNVIPVILALVILTAFFLAPILMSTGEVSFPIGSPILAFLLWYGMLMFLACTFIREFLWTVRDRSIMNRGSGSATARILDRQACKGDGPYNASTTYHVKFEFTPMLAETSSGSLTLTADVSEEIYKRLTPGITATVTYATGDPRIVLFEGE